MLEQLFGSKTRLKLLKAFFREPDKPFFIRELTREIEAHINAVRRELDLLSEAGLVMEVEAVDTKVNEEEATNSLRKYYLLNKECPFFKEMQALLNKAQVAHEQELIKKIRQKAGDFKLIIMAGRLVGDAGADTDLLLVGKFKSSILNKIMVNYEETTGVEVRYTTMSEEEFFERRFVMDRFLYSILEGNNLKVVNELNI